MTKSKATKINKQKNPKDIVPLILIFRAQGILINYPPFLRVKDRSVEVSTEFRTLSHVSVTGQVLPPSQESIMSRNSDILPPPPSQSIPTMELF